MANRSTALARHDPELPGLAKRGAREAEAAFERIAVVSATTLLRRDELVLAPTLAGGIPAYGVVAFYPRSGTKAQVQMLDRDQRRRALRALGVQISALLAVFGSIVVVALTLVCCGSQVRALLTPVDPRGRHDPLVLSAMVMGRAIIASWLLVRDCAGPVRRTMAELVGVANRSAEQ